MGGVSRLRVPGRARRRIRRAPSRRSRNGVEIGAIARHICVTSEAIPMSEERPPFPPFTRETAIQKVRLAEDAWNSRDPVRVSMAYTVDSQWRNRAEFPVGREQIVEFLTRKWNRELEHRLIKAPWACADDRIAVRFAYES